MKLFALAVLVLALSGSTCAQDDNHHQGVHVVDAPPPRVIRLSLAARVWHDKWMYLGDAVNVASTIADLHTSDQCQAAARRAGNPALCIEENNILGPHPSTARFVAFGFGIDAVFITLRHVGCHFAPDHGGCLFLNGLLTIPYAVQSIWSTQNNIDNTDHIEHLQLAGRINCRRAGGGCW